MARNLPLKTSDAYWPARLMVAWFRSQGYSKVAKAKSKNYWYLYFPRQMAEQLVETVRPFIHESMAYKVGGQHG